MNILKPDSPVMNFLSTVADLLILDILTILCSLPIITIGAATTAKYYVAMKVIRGEGTGVVVPFFKSFKCNFKQSTVVWFIMMLVIALLILDWRWVMYNGWNNTAFIYQFGVIAFTAVVLLINMVVYPTIARYEMRTAEVFKAAFLFVLIRFIPLILIALLIVGAFIACLWYAQWFPLVYAFTSSTITYFLCLVCIKQFDKLEKQQAEKLKALKESVEYNPETDAVGNVSLAGNKKEAKALEKNLEKPDAEADKSGNRFTRFIRTEKEKLKDLSFKQKAAYFAQYYLPGIIVVAVLLTAVVWYGHDIYVDKMRVLGGGIINGYPSEEGRTYVTDGFLSWAGYGKGRTAALLDSEDLNFNSDLEYEDKYLEVAFRASILTGTYDYLIMREDAVYNYSTPDYFIDLSELVNMDNFSEDDFYYYVATEEEKAKRSQGISINDILGKSKKEDDKPIPVALKLTDDIKKKLGLDEQYEYYIAFAHAIDAGGNQKYLKFIEYLYGKC